MIQSSSHRRRQVKGLVGNRRTSKQSFLRGTSRLQFDMAQPQITRQWTPMNFGPGAAVVTDEVTDVACVQNRERLHQFLEQDALQVARVPFAANTLIRRVEINQIVRPGS